MSGDPTGGDLERIGLDDPRSLTILTTEHWSLLMTRTLGYQEMFGRSTVFVAVLSASAIALTLLAQATRFGREMLWLALLLILVTLFIGLVTFVRSVAINYEDALWVTGMNLLRHAYLKIAPELEPYFVTGHEPDAAPRPLGHGSPQRPANLANSLTTTSGVVATLNSVLAGSLAGDLGALLGGGLAVGVALAVAVSLVSAGLHVRYAARFRKDHALSRRFPR
jgi:hypothetical protein